MIGPVPPTASTPPTPPTGLQAGGSGGGETFGQMLSQAVNQIGQSATNAQALQAEFATGGNVSIDQVLVATTQAELMTETAAAVTSRALTAYQNVMSTNLG